MTCEVEVGENGITAPLHLDIGNLRGDGEGIDKDAVLVLNALYSMSTDQCD